MIPGEKRAAAMRGLREAFGVTDFEDIRELNGGVGSNPVFRIAVRGSAFLLRINMRAGDLARHFACMQAAAEGGVAPRVWYASVEDRVSITDFVEPASFPMTDALVRVPGALRALHALRPFPGVPHHINTSCMFLINEGPALDGLLQRFQAAGILPKSEIEEMFAWRARLAAVYPRHGADMVSSHNDLFMPDNILFDGHRVWLVDWEAAFLNDRYADLAAVANQLVTDDAEEWALLQAYFGQPPDEYQLARLFVTRQISHMFYAMAFLLFGSAGKAVDWSETVPEFGDLQRRTWVGEVDLKENHLKLLYGRAHWERFLRNLGQARFAESMRIVADGRACRAGTPARRRDLSRS